MGYPPQPPGPPGPPQQPGPYQPDPQQHHDPYQQPTPYPQGDPYQGNSGPQAGMPAGPPPYGPPPHAPHPPPGSGGGNTGLIVALVIGAVVLLGAGGLVVFLLMSPRPAGPAGTAADDFPELEPLDLPELEPLDEQPGAEGAGEPSTILPEFDGEWEGMMFQFDEAGNEFDTWILTLDMSGDESTAVGELNNGSEHYCSWDLEVTQSSADLLEFSVVATDRDVSCVRDSQLSLVLVEDDEIEAAWSGEFSDGEFTLAGGVLNR